MKTNYLALIWLRGYGALKADAQNSYLGSLWWLLEPLLLSCLLYLAFSSGLRATSGPEFFTFLVFGMIPLKWTQSCIQNGASTLLSNKGIIGQVYIPKWVFPTCANLSQLIRFCAVLPLLVIISAYFTDSQYSNYFQLLPVISVQLLLNLGVSMLFCALVPLIPDISHIIPLVSMGLMFTSGVFFDIATRPPEIRQLLEFNPMVDILNAYRRTLLYDTQIHFSDLSYPFIFGMISTVIALLVLKSLDRLYPRIL